jgi:hypothetical protein
MLEACPPSVLLLAGFAVGAVPRRAWMTLSRLRRGAEAVPSTGEGSGSSDGSDDS